MLRKGKKHQQRHQDEGKQSVERQRIITGTTHQRELMAGERNGKENDKLEVFSIPRRQEPKHSWFPKEPWKKIIGRDVVEEEEGVQIPQV